MSNGDGVDWIARGIAIVGINISVVLGIIKYLEYRRTHISLKATYIWRGLQERGNSILVMNESVLPVCIINYEILAKKGLAGKSISLVNNEDEFAIIKIDALSAQEFTFAEQDHFALPNALGTVFIKLWIVGRKQPLWVELG